MRGMASTRKAFMFGTGVRMMELWLGLLLIALAVCASSGADSNIEMAAPVHDDLCPEYQYVYPYWSVCFWPLRHFQAFHLVSRTLGGLETATILGTELVSFTGSGELLGATYYAVPLARDPLLGVAVNTDVVLVNSQTLQPLTWTFQAWFRGLVLTEGNLATVFRFSNTSESLACPRIANARCESYHLVSDSAPYGFTSFNVSELGGIVIMPASDITQSLSFVAILPSADVAAAQSAESTFRISDK